MDFLKLKTELLEYLNSLNFTTGVYFETLKSKKIFAYNENEEFEAASIIKIFIMIEALKQVEDKKFKLNERFKIDIKKPGGTGILEYLDSSNTFTLLDLLIFMMAISDNYATNFLIDLLGVENINETINRIGLTKTEIQRKMMDFDALKSGLKNIVTPFETSFVLKKIYGEKILSSKSSKIMKEILSYNQFKDLIAYPLPSKLRLFGKTGGMPKTIHDTQIVEGLNEPYILTVFTQNFKISYEAKTAISNLSLKFFKFMSHN